MQLWLYLRVWLRYHSCAKYLVSTADKLNRSVVEVQTACWKFMIDLNGFIVFSTWPLDMIEQNQDIVEWCGRIGRRQRDNSACAGSPLFAYRAPWRHGRNNERQTTGGVFVKCIVWICSKVKWYNVKPLRITAGSQYRAHIDSWVCAQEIMGTGTF